jgi:hypothetical protein
MGVMNGGIDLGAVLGMLASFGLAVWAIVILPVETVWLRWVINPLVMSLPTLVVLDLFLSRL